MKKLISTIFLAVAAVAMTTASAGEIALKVNLKNGSSEQFRISETPTVTVVDHQMSVKSSVLETGYAFEDVSHFTFGDYEMDAVEGIDSEVADFSFTYLDNSTIIISAPGLENATVFTLNGVQAITAQASNNEVTLDISALSPGVYLVAPSNHAAIKIIKK